MIEDIQLMVFVVAGESGGVGLKLEDGKLKFFDDLGYPPVLVEALTAAARVTAIARGVQDADVKAQLQRVANDLVAPHTREIAGSARIMA